MKHITFSCLFLLVFWCGLDAQTQNLEVIGAAGEVSSGSKITLDWTLGEVATSTILHENGMLTEGFHQPYLSVQEIEVEALPDILQSPASVASVLTFRAYPNPTAASLWVDIAAPQPEGRTFLILTDLNGATLSQQTTMLKESTLELDLTPYAAGSYYLLLKDDKGNILKAAKILKIH